MNRNTVLWVIRDIPIAESPYRQLRAIRIPKSLAPLQISTNPFAPSVCGRLSKRMQFIFQCEISVKFLASFLPNVFQGCNCGIAVKVQLLLGHLARVAACCAAMGAVAPMAVPQMPQPATAQPHADPPLPDIRWLIQEVQEHQRQLDKVRESYTYTSMEIGQDIDANGQIKKTETKVSEVSFVNGHIIGRTVKKNGQPLSEHDQQKETERVTKLVEEAEKTPPVRPPISISRVLEIMDVSNERRMIFRGRTTIVFDFVGRRDAKTHGRAEDASKKLQGTIWIDEADCQVAHLEAVFIDNFHVAGGFLANIQKGSNFHFDQELVNGEIWLPTGVEGAMQARVLLLKNLRRRSIERDYDYKRFKVETQQKDTEIARPKKP